MIHGSSATDEPGDELVYRLLVKSVNFFLIMKAIPAL